MIARVGTQVVTKLELQNELRLMNVADELRGDPQMIRRALKDLVVRKYLVQQAVDAAMDREPNILLESLRARDQTLASAYVARRVVARAPSADDVRNFVSDNPEKFSARQMLKLEEISLPLKEYSKEIANAVRDAGSMNDVDGTLTRLGVLHDRTVRSVSEAELPPPLRLALLAKQGADVVFVKSEPRGVFMSALSREKAPMDGPAAEALARQILNARVLQEEFAAESRAADAAVHLEADYAAIMNAEPRP